MTSLINGKIDLGRKNLCQQEEIGNTIPERGHGQGQNHGMKKKERALEKAVKRTVAMWPQLSMEVTIVQRFGLLEDIAITISQKVSLGDPL